MIEKLAFPGVAKPAKPLGKIATPLSFSVLSQLIKALNSKGLRPDLFTSFKDRGQLIKALNSKGLRRPLPPYRELLFS